MEKQRPLRGASVPLGPPRSSRRTGDGRSAPRLRYSTNLSPREEQILKKWCEGLEYSAIAEVFGIKRSTVNTTMSCIRDKAGIVRDRAGLLEWARDYFAQRSELNSGSCYDDSHEHQAKDPDVLGDERDPAGDHHPGARTAVEET